MKNNLDKELVVMGQGRCPDCGAQLGSSLHAWEQHDCKNVKNLPSRWPKPEEITEEHMEGNKLIDQFMSRNKVGKLIKAWPTMYHKDWGKIMEVVEDIEEFSVNANNIKYQQEAILIRVALGTVQVHRMYVWRPIVNFVKLYNKLNVKG